MTALTPAERERIALHIQRGWKVPDSLVAALVESHDHLERHAQLIEAALGLVRADNAVSTDVETARAACAAARALEDAAAAADPAIAELVAAARARRAALAAAQDAALFGPGEEARHG